MGDQWEQKGEQPSRSPAMDPSPAQRLNGQRHGSSPALTLYMPQTHTPSFLEHVCTRSRRRKVPAAHRLQLKARLPLSHPDGAK